MNIPIARRLNRMRAITAVLALVMAPAAWHCHAATPASPASVAPIMLAQGAAPAAAPAPAAAALPSPVALSWTFTASEAVAAWSAERGRITFADGAARLQPDANRRVVLLSPPGLPEGSGAVEKFTLAIPGTGLQRVRVQGQRDARGGWITIADARGDTLLSTPDGYVLQRKAGTRTAPIDRLRIELEFRTSNPRVLQRIIAQ